MSKKDLIDAVAEATELSKDKAGVAVEAVIKHIEKTMKDGQEVRIPGFGTFKVANRKARKARNPRTGERVNDRGQPAAHSTSSAARDAPPARWIRPVRTS